MRIEILVFDGFDALDVVAPWEVFVRAGAFASNFEVALVRTGGNEIVRAAEGMELRVVEEVGSPDAILVPGGSWVSGEDTGVPKEIRLGAVPRVIGDLANSVRWVSSVCTGSLLLGAAGLLQGRNATSNHAALEEISRYGARVREHRVVDDGNIVTCGGVTAGIDLALWLVEREIGAEASRSVAAAMEYPVPPDVWRAQGAAGAL
ncbi:DJ-1/PfpI family protein [Antrihabitans sp. YC2-6]|uniref:DJ-1/PfpI family protein n=1 Tax=Antrihabitans sp. YC2-6 TaxID=2799498 RepID=UPI0018F661B7|nr:DJ-1/PfpI family protein [Antrihabitans sp. YC2-6]MBJ8344758.1 DJ-1/PfpI family protein [Antrihabitans sp. YC2-6]